MYDIFLSHNRLQKSWVRTLYEFLISKGLAVFFDEESIPPGTNIVTAIEDALQQSRHVVLILSSSSLASKWVAMETQLTVQDDPDARRSALIPVVLEKVKWENVRPTIRSLNCIDLSDYRKREERLRFLLRHLGINDIDSVPTSQLHNLLIFPRTEETMPLSVADINDVIDWKWDGIKLLDEFIRLDYETLDNLVPAHEGHSIQ